VTTINDKYMVLCSTLTAMILKPRDREIALTPEYFGGMLGAPCGTGLTRSYLINTFKPLRDCKLCQSE
jgi:hypothetical protein